MGTVFISYRRGDSSGHTGRLFDDLEERFGRAAFFRDLENLELGIDFPAALDKALTECQVVLVMIGPGWLNAESGGVRRLDQPEDFVRIEVAAALARSDVHVIPVLVGGATMPSASSLPEPLKRLATRNGIELSDTRWDYDLSRLGDGLVRTAGLTDTAPRAPEVGSTRPASDVATKAEKRGSMLGKVGVFALGIVATIIALVAIGADEEEGAATDAPLATFEHAGLTWTTDTADTDYDWNEAVEHCQNVGDGFRLPTIEELRTIADPNDANASGRKLLRPFHDGVHSNWIWSADEDGEAARLAFDFDTLEPASLAINFGDGAQALCVSE